MIQAILKMLTAAETNVPDMNLLEVILDKMNSSDRVNDFMVQNFL
jgi:hypothetical protein